MELHVDFIDAFTESTFKGNPAAVIITEQWLSDDLMQSIATENNLSETAFLVADPTSTHQTSPEHSQRFAIRWFSPITEIAFCGHATLASAFVLFKKHPTLSSITFSAKAVGELIVSKTNTGLIEMDFPNTKPKKVDTFPAELSDGLSIKPTEVYQNQHAYFVIYPSEEDVNKVLRDNETLKQLAPLDVVVTAQSKNNNYDFSSRYFWPANGGDEDPVTGSIHSGLAPLWFEKLDIQKRDKKILKAYQASQRGGILHCELKGERVFISGAAVQYLSGTIYI